MTTAIATGIEVRERPIIFTGESVNAILDGHKTQTRRVLKTQPELRDFGHGPVPALVPPLLRAGYLAVGVDTFNQGEYGPVKCPYGVPGDQLWVREKWCMRWNGSGVPDYWDDYWYAAEPDHNPTAVDGDGAQRYRKDGTEASPWRSPQRMPREAARIFLEVVGVRVERVQDITEADAIAEGVDHMPSMPASMTHRGAFAKGWDAINGKRAPWASNPFVWVVTFRR